MHPHRSLPTKLPRLRVGSRLQPTPAAASTDQQNHPDSSRLVCHSGSGPMRAGPPLPCRQNHRIRSARELVGCRDALRFGLWSETAERALRAGPGRVQQAQARQFRRALFCAPVLAGLNSWRPTGRSVCTWQQPRLTQMSHLCAAVSSGCHGKGKGAGQQMYFVAWTQIAHSWAEANRKPSLAGHSTQTATSLAKMSRRSCSVFSNSRSSSRTACTTIFIPTSRAFEATFSAGRTGCIYEE